MNSQTQSLENKPIAQGEVVKKGLITEKAATYIYLVFSFVTISVFGIFALLPAFSTISTLNKQYADNKKVADALEVKLNALANLDKEYQTIEKDLPYVYNAIPSSSQIPTFVRQAETIALENNVTLQSLSTGTVEFYPLENNTSDLFSYSFSIEAVGDEKNVNNFIKTIISFNRLTSIDRITTGKISGNTYKASIGGRVYFSKDVTP